jgi:purine-nucleoside phosphorylase
MSYLEMLRETVSYIENFFGDKPEVGIICGTGLGTIAEEIKDAKELPYGEIPNFPASSVKGHANKLVFGTMGSKKVLAFQGRFHYYEGYSMQEVTLPARVMQLLGCKNMVVTNAAGGLNRNYEVGDIMLIEDHINFMFQNPLIGRNFEELGPRFPDMSQPYKKSSMKLAEEIALQEKITLRKGTYIAVTGPSYETRAELRFFNRFGDAVGMSTVPEVIVANHAGIPGILGLSVITNKATGEDTHEESHDSVVQAANAATPRVVRLVTEFVKRC